MSSNTQEFRAISPSGERGRARAATQAGFAKLDRVKAAGYLLVGLLSMAVLSGCAANPDLVAKINSAYGAYGPSFAGNSTTVVIGSAAN